MNAYFVAVVTNQMWKNVKDTYVSIMAVFCFCLIKFFFFVWSKFPAAFILGQNSDATNGSSIFKEPCEARELY